MSFGHWRWRKTLYAFLAITLGLLSITAHELGHYEAMRRSGVKVKEVGLLGFPLRYIPSFRWKGKKTTWCIHPFLVGAYVQANSENAIKTKSLWDQLYIYGNGPIANIVYALAFVIIALLISLIENGEDSFALSINGKSFTLEANVETFLVLGGVTWLVWVGRRFIALALPVVTFPILVLVGYTIFSIDSVKAVEGGAGGPVAVVAFLTGAKTIAQAFLLAAFLSINFALINLAPLPPLDGGHIFGACIKKYFGEKVEGVYNMIGEVLFVAVVVWALSLDGLRISSWF